jgi:hypothetical protein
MLRLGRRASEALPEKRNHLSRSPRDGEVRDPHEKAVLRGARCNPILKDEMAAIYANCDSVTVEGYDTVSRGE